MHHTEFDEEIVFYVKKEIFYVQFQIYKSAQRFLVQFDLFNTLMLSESSARFGSSVAYH